MWLPGFLQSCRRRRQRAAERASLSARLNAYADRLEAVAAAGRSVALNHRRTMEDNAK